MEPAEFDGDLERVLIVGAGSLGTVYGARLARSGCEVQLLCREPHGRALRKASGVLLETMGHEPETISVDAVWDYDDVRAADVVIVLTKTYDTAEALAGIQRIARDVRLAVSLQNGLAKNDMLASWCGPDRVVGGASMVGGTMIAPGHVRHTFEGPTFLGELSEGGGSRTERLVGMLADAGLEAEAVSDIHSVEWSKLAQVLPAMSVTALTRRYYHEVLLSPELAGVFVGLVKEVGAVARAEGTTLLDWPAMLPVGTLSTAPYGEAIERVLSFGQQLMESGAVSIKPSMFQSVERGSRLEVEEIQGFVARRAAHHGVDVPRVATCYELLSGIDRLVRTPFASP